MTMKATDVLQLFRDQIPTSGHMLSYFSRGAARGIFPPFTTGLLDSLWDIEQASPGYAAEMINRIAGIRGEGNEQYESLLQICAEVYVTRGATISADSDEHGKKLFKHEPTAAKNSKNPEFEAKANGCWYAVEVKTPKLNQFAETRAQNAWQVTARMPAEITAGLNPTLPRDNPVMDFLISANAKFETYVRSRPDAFRILTIVWDDFVQEPLSALLSPVSGLLTDNSFYKKDGKPVIFPFIDAIILCRYTHQLKRLTVEGPLLYEEHAFYYHHGGYPPKVLIQNPVGRVIPESLLEPLNAVPHANLLSFAEYRPQELIMWMPATKSPDN
jgi:hypothetical protein